MKCAKAFSAFMVLLISVPVLWASPGMMKSMPTQPKKEEKAKPKPIPPPDTAAMVNNVPITIAALKRAMTGGRFRGLDQAGDEYRRIRDEILNQMIETELIYQAAQKIEFPGVEEKVEKVVSESLKLVGDGPDRELRLQQMGISEKLMRANARRDILVKEFIEKEIYFYAEVPDDDVRKFYENPENRRHFVKKYGTRASHILIGVAPTAPEPSRVSARQKAESMLARLASGVDFAVLARENSTDASASQGGDLGFITSGSMPKTFEDAVNSMKPGEVSRVIETPMGYHIIKVTERREDEVKPFEQEAPSIRAYLEEKTRHNAYQMYLGTLKRKADIEILVK